MNSEAMTCIGPIASLFLLVLSLTAWLSPRHPAQRRPAIVLVPFGTPPDTGALKFLFVKERAADCARCLWIPDLYTVVVRNKNVLTFPVKRVRPD